MGAVRTRFAPSPTGYLHLGHAYSAFQASDFARNHGGAFLLRIEDIDPGRRRAAFETAIYEDLAWLGLDWERPVRRQSEHVAAHRASLDRLQAMGVLYRCFKTRPEILADIVRAPHGVSAYPGPSAPLSRDEEAARLDKGEPFAWRISLSAAQARLGPAWTELGYREIGEAPGWTPARLELTGDAVIARKDAGLSYHLACCHDDAQQGITHVVRGVDLVASTGLHVLLQALLDWPTPVYRHHKLILGPDGKRLAKRDKAATLRAMRAEGLTPEAVRARAEAAPKSVNP
ncbi:MAG: tRNA glutamyl-Q(34) synthetase GluQRS [Maricaulaceae bacterium]